MGNIVCASNVKQPTKKAFHFPGPKATSHDVQGLRAKTVARTLPAEAIAAKQTVRTQPASSVEALAPKPVHGDAKAARKMKGAREDGFRIPESDHVKLAALKQRCFDAGLQVNKTELLRAGVAMLEVASLKRLIGAVENLEPADTTHSHNKHVVP